MTQPSKGPDPDPTQTQVPYGIPRAHPQDPRAPAGGQPVSHDQDPPTPPPQDSSVAPEHPTGAPSPDWAQRLRNLAAADTSIDQTTMARAGLALLSLVGFLLPWVTMDGSSSSHSGAELILHSFTGPERGALARVTLLGALSLLFVPPVSAVLTIIIFFRTLKAERPMVLNILAIFLPALMLFLAAPIVSSTHPTIMGVLLPSWGIALVMLTQAALLGHAIRVETAAQKNPQ